ncbi:unnamed protein product [Symbiodinium natans]|uniref:Uncharacterized protein n=1 Tax=Symbiodinium natans TaxID=878477 RepID=A0A812NIK5_9DINO|nr:unnamed protein product [Symbiodinium natans]
MTPHELHSLLQRLLELNSPGVLRCAIVLLAFNEDLALAKAGGMPQGGVNMLWGPREQVCTSANQDGGQRPGSPQHVDTALGHASCLVEDNGWLPQSATLIQGFSLHDLPLRRRRRHTLSLMNKSARPLTKTAASDPHEYDAVAVFAGAAALSRCLGLAGHCVASLEIDSWAAFAKERKDKYEKDKIEYWVEEETKGTYKVAESELYTDKHEIDATEDCADENNPSESDSDDDNECESDDDESSEDSENSDKKGKKRNAKKSKKAKKDKKQKTKHRARGSPSSKSKDDLEEETPAEAIRSEPTFPKLYIAPRQSFLALPGHRERWR